MNKPFRYFLKGMESIAFRILIGMAFWICWVLKELLPFIEKQQTILQ